MNYFYRMSHHKFCYKKFTAIGFYILFLVNISIVNTVFSKQNNKIDNYSVTSKITIILILNNTNFGCQICLDSFIELCDQLQESEKLTNSIYGVLCYDSKENENNKENILIQKKLLRGFIKGNNIQFPFILDSSQIFKDLCNNGSQKIIIINGEKGCIKQWDIPLKLDQFEEVMNFIF